MINNSLQRKKHYDGRQSACYGGRSIMTGVRVLATIGKSIMTGDRVLATMEEAS